MPMGRRWHSLSRHPRTCSPTPPLALRAVLADQAAARSWCSISSFDPYRAVSFFIDAPTIEELDEIEERVRQAVTIHTA